MKFNIDGKTHHEPGIDVREHVLPSDRRRHGAWNSLRRLWWRLWTGYDSESAVRRRLEQDAMRYGGKIQWGDER